MSHIELCQDVSHIELCQDVSHIELCQDVPAVAENVPVWAQAMRSRPPITMGMEYFCTGVGFV